ncbi:MAG TPA: hypothetical protein VE907_06325 [Gammaproteobacteria bacterium]|nr:hypothetical protein [Gammaproteobacteria bacterium]
MATLNAVELLARLKPLVAAARSWHNFHHGSSVVQCDAICDALPEAEEAVRELEATGTHTFKATEGFSDCCVICGESESSHE